MHDKHTELLQQLTQAYTARYAGSQQSHARSLRVMVDGISHGARTWEPFPVRIRAAQGAWVTSEDGQQLVDYWQGHFANILGHNPREIVEPLLASLQADYGLQTGLPEEQEITYAEMLTQATGADQVRLTTSGTLATMYALMIARAYTGRKLVVKVGGGWHGANPLALKGVSHSGSGYGGVDSAGVSAAAEEEILVTRFNDSNALEELFREHGDRIAAFIFEPCPSVGGFVPATKTYMHTARALTERCGAILIVDEVITGFRYCASSATSLYGVQPDLATYGKIIGGGMPIAAVTGRRDLLALTSDSASPRVWFNGGTYSAHPLALTAGIAMLQTLKERQDTLYPALSRRATELRNRIEQVFADRGVLARCSGAESPVLGAGSLASVYFPLQDDLAPQGPDDLNDPRLCDVVLREQVLKLGLLLAGVNVVHGLGALSTEHGDREFDVTCEAFDRIALQIKGMPRRQ
ncbi:MAG: aspartate aminotransferase family protein [Anaerolineae bacterium]|jgi:glutamate-1-semialdehyde 2,1-aminomutase|nr:aminotransferase class III-fold pyridoxal phosphate-dependent enzyme [Chloroflexota bacterium]